MKDHAVLIERQPAWEALLQVCLEATTTRPTRKWREAAGPLLAQIGREEFDAPVEKWIELAAQPAQVAGGPFAQWQMVEGGQVLLKGLVWCMTQFEHTGDKPRLIADLLSTSLKKIPGVGPRSLKVANACAWSLGEMAGSSNTTIRDAALAHLARLKSRVTVRPTLKAIEKALDRAAERAGMSRDDLEELGVPSFGFHGGARREELGGATAELRVQGNKVSTDWVNEKGKPVKSPPAAIKRDFKDDLKQLKQAAADADGILLAGRDRLDNLYLLEKSWKLADWRERYLDHGLMGTIARRLIWTIDGIAVTFAGDKPVDLSGRPLEFRETAEVRLWHPIGRDAAEVTHWRRRLAELGITQPFKQAHREVYLLTDAERNTGSYSNRFAAHILRQHQMKALADSRRWIYRLQGTWDGGSNASKQARAFNLTAEFWVEGIGEYGPDTSDAGVFLRVATDRVRFYENGEREPLPLDQIPPLVFSEILRDCDLFVGVASVGNDPTWQDGGPQGRFRDYWQDYSFGDLSQTAQTRKAVLENLIPRLAIASRCSLTDKFLVVRGDVRTYKIHLGSGNILMEPNDQYLCIVPDQRQRTAPAGDAGMFLPFEGDRTLSVILSKALLLAEDTKIRDSTIVSQIGRRA